MDPLSDVLSLLKPRSSISTGFDAGGDWSVRFSGNVGIKCYAVISGQCWLAVDGIAEAVHLQAGDAFLLPGGRPFRLASDLALPPVLAETVFDRHRDRRTGGICYNGGGDLFLVGSRFELSGDAGILLKMLPPIVHLRKQSDQAALRWCVERMIEELREARPGGDLIAQHLSHMMLVQALRLHMAESAQSGVGWLFALTDRQMGAAINAMHAEPAHNWTLQTLAERAGMSRSTFALRFKTTVGTSAMDYLTRWRMLLAAERLETSADSVSAIALSLGYESDSAFSTAFKRVIGCSPRQYGRSANDAAPMPPAATSAGL
ncbi:AraC family transcriptional regulator [Devosia sp.]|uniref:AraC family transcriptional regulator n=1 Tax=Devosia sp. TaxID=1871048 RepID=UPI0032642D78